MEIPDVSRYEEEKAPEVVDELFVKIAYNIYHNHGDCRKKYWEAYFIDLRNEVDADAFM